MVISQQQEGWRFMEGWRISSEDLTTESTGIYFKNIANCEL